MVIRMRNDTDRPPVVETLPVGDSFGDEVRALVQDFVDLLKDADAEVAARMRAEVASRFGGRFCSDAVCARMIELLNGRLADTAGQPESVG